jgi:hypothetical protein
LQSKSGRPDSSLTTGASLIASGRVPKTNKTFMPRVPVPPDAAASPRELAMLMGQPGRIDDDAAHQLLARDLPKE